MSCSNQTTAEGYILTTQAYQELLRAQQQACALQQFFTDPTHKSFIGTFHAVIDRVLSQARQCRSCAGVG